ncbi:MAG: sodium:calcium antiporter [Candidatus Woesearchaeota archaeon]
MVELLLNTIIILISFYILFKSSYYLVTISSIFAHKFNISKLIIGLTIVAIGTSLPELASVFFGVITSYNGSEFLTGTIIGSNIANVLLVGGVLLIFSQNKINSFTFKENIFLLSSVVLFIVPFLTSINLYIISILLLINFSLYLLLFHVRINLKKFKICKISSSKNEKNEEIEEILSNPLTNKSNIILSFYLLISIFFLSASARLIVFSIDEIATILQIPTFILTFTTIAIASSLPELFVTIQAVKLKQQNLAIGNIIGSNIANILLIGGVGIFISKINSIPVFINSFLPIYFLIIITIILTLFPFISKFKYSRILGIILIIVYLLILVVNFLN